VRVPTWTEGRSWSCGSRRALSWLVIIRKLLGSDYDSFHTMRIGMLELNARDYTAGASDWRNASQEQIMSYLRENEEGSDNFVLGAFRDGELVGMLGFRRETRATVRHKGSTWGLFAKPGLENVEVEKLLLAEAIKTVRSYADFEYIRTVQNVSNIEKIDLFLALGFKKYGLEERSMRVGQQYFDQVYLKLVV